MWCLVEFINYHNNMIDKNTNYIVASFPRSGSALTMKILKDGGMDVVYDKSVDEERDKSVNWGEPDYHPNPHGYFDLPSDKSALDVVGETKGRVVKTSVINQLVELPDGKYKIIFLLRNPEERSKSMAKSYIKTHLPKLDPKSDKESFVKKEYPFLFDREDIEVLFVKFSSLIFNPEKEVKRISDFLEVKLDIDKAISVVNPELYRFRK